MNTLTGMIRLKECQSVVRISKRFRACFLPWPTASIKFLQIPWYADPPFIFQLKDVELFTVVKACLSTVLVIFQILQLKRSLETFHKFCRHMALSRQLKTLNFWLVCRVRKWSRVAKSNQKKSLFDFKIQFPTHFVLWKYIFISSNIL